MSLQLAYLFLALDRLCQVCAKHNSNLALEFASWLKVRFPTNEGGFARWTGMRGHRKTLIKRLKDEADSLEIGEIDIKDVKTMIDQMRGETTAALKKYDDNVVATYQRETEFDGLTASHLPSGTRAGLHLIHQYLEAINERNICLSAERQTSLISAISKLMFSLKHAASDKLIALIDQTRHTIVAIFAEHDQQRAALLSPRQAAYYGRDPTKWHDAGKLRRN